MRLSTYEIILPLVGTDEKPIEGYTLLTNGLYGAVDVVPKEDADKLQAGDFAGLPAALRERLMLRGHKEILPDCPPRCGNGLCCADISPAKTKRANWRT